MKKELFELERKDSKEMPAYLWLPEGEIRAVIQVIHGMTEHMGRYERFAEIMCAEGIAVAGFDLRGHGRNFGNPKIASFGEGGWADSIEDIRQFHLFLKQRFAENQHYMLGFSLGSFLLREYLTKYPVEKEIFGAIIMGTGHQPRWLLSMMMSIVKGQIAKVGFDMTTDLVRTLSFGTYNQKFKPNRTDADWLCADETELDIYLADPLVRKDISSGLFWELLGSMKRTGGIASDRENINLPILLISGGDDPVGDGGKGVEAVYQRMKKAGMGDVTMKIFPDARHDLLHEEKTCAQAARNYMIEWMGRNCG